MKYIAKPKPLTLGAGQFGLDELLEYLVATDRRFNESGAGIRAGIRIEDSVKLYKKHAYLVLEPAHYALLAQAAEEPTGGYPKAVGQLPDGQRIERYLSRDLLPFLDAIRDAKDELPANLAHADESAVS